MAEIPEEAVEALRSARSVAAITGAGISAESGMPTFRDPADEDALWATWDPMDLASPEGFARDPGLVTRWYAWRLGRCSGGGPNAGHRALAELERRVVSRSGAFTLLTQNVDGLHQAAGSERVHELHGSIRTWRCSSCGVPGEHPSRELEDYPPRCAACGAPLRPDVVWFGESLPEGPLRAGMSASMSCDVFLSIGTSAVVYPAAGFAEMAAERGAALIEVNREPTPLTPRATWSIRGRCGEALPELVGRAFDG
jgi:NAD-dependent deacetylase